MNRTPNDISPVSSAPNHVAFERLKVGITQVGPSIAESMRWHTEEDRLRGRMVHKLTAYVLAERLPPVAVSEAATVTWPQWASWWDHWKADHSSRWWAAWWTRRRPARTVECSRTVTVTVDLQKYITYPQARIVTPDFGDPVRVATWDTSQAFGTIRQASP